MSVILSILLSILLAILLSILGLIYSILLYVIPSEQLEDFLTNDRHLHSERNNLARTVNSTVTSPCQLLEPLLTSDGVRPNDFPLDTTALNNLDSE